MRLLVPRQLWLVESFANSLDTAGGRDHLDSVSHLRDWLAAYRPAAADRVTEDDVVLACEVRDALRAQLRTHGVGEADSTGLEKAAARVPLRACATSYGVGLAPVGDGVPGVLGEIIAAAVLASHDGTFRRLKICREPGCQVAFYDWSRNASRCWCSMQTCGNRNKTRAYRGRRRQAAAIARAATTAG